jgi:hypothetical protein
MPPDSSYIILSVLMDRYPHPQCDCDGERFPCGCRIRPEVSLLDYLIVPLRKPGKEILKNPQAWKGGFSWEEKKNRYRQKDLIRRTRISTCAA